MTKFEVDFLTDYSEPSIVAELKRIASELGKASLTRRDIDSHGRMSSTVVLKRFGSLRRALQAADMKPTRFMKASNDELLDVVEQTWVTSLERFGRRPERADLKAFGSSVSADTVVRRFGSWKAALTAVADRADPNRHGAGPIARPPGNQPAVSSPRRAISVSRRFFVLKRDRYSCRLCKATGVALEVDHIVPYARGGSDDLTNLQTLCFDCNRGKSDNLQ